MGSGKSTVGQTLARQLEYHFFDTDVLIEQASGCPIPEIFATAGEAAFRQLETQVLAELSPYKRLVIATGGGIVLRSENWGYLQHGLVVWLDAPLELLHRRLQQDAQQNPDVRPLLQSDNLWQRLETLLGQRRAYYAQADVRVAVQADETPTQVATLALEEIQKILRPEVLADWEDARRGILKKDDTH